MIDPARWFEPPVVPRLAGAFDGRVGKFLRRFTDGATFTVVVVFGYL